VLASRAATSKKKRKTQEVRKGILFLMSCFIIYIATYRGIPLNIIGKFYPKGI